MAGSSVDRLELMLAGALICGPLALEVLIASLPFGSKDGPVARGRKRRDENCPIRVMA